jgi:hypothetical protein
MKETRTCKVPEEAVCEGITVRVGKDWDTDIRSVVRRYRTGFKISSRLT